jgi:hypothetical protein
VRAVRPWSYPATPTPRRAELRLRLTEDEMEAFLARAQAAQRRPSEYLRVVALRDVGLLPDPQEAVQA